MTVTKMTQVLNLKFDQLNNALKQFDEESCWALYFQELKTKKRHSYADRIHGRASILRGKREKAELSDHCNRRRTA